MNHLVMIVLMARMTLMRGQTTTKYCQHTGLITTKVHFVVEDVDRELSIIELLIVVYDRYVLETVILEQKHNVKTCGL
jgi:hypothetical protein